MEPALVWGIFTRLVGVVAFIAVAPLYPQILQNCGSQGHSPIAPRLRRMRADFPLHVLLLHVPTLLWLTASDWFLKTLVVAGSLAALLAAYGGPFSHWALLGCFVVLLSFDRALDQSFPWECLLMEMLAMSALLPALEPLPGLRALAEPLPVQAFFFNALLVRLLLGFGKMKFAGATRRDHTYLREFLINQPLPSPLGWYAYHLPVWIHKLGLVLLFAAEIPLPILALLPGPVRLLPFASTLALMLAIQLTGTFGYFNLVVAVLCLPLLDLQASIFNIRWEQMTGSWYALGLHVGVAVLALGWLLCFPFNSWCARSWMHWPALANNKLRALQPLLAFYRWLADLRLIHPYGVFPPQAQAAVKFTPVLQGSLDGREWRDYEHRLMPTTEASPPRFIAPLHVRWDQFMVYAGYAMDLGGLAATTFNNALPTNFTRHPAMRRVMQRLLEGEPAAQRLFRRDPFAGTPPRYMRQVTAVLDPLSVSEHRRTGLWWRRHLIATEWPAVASNLQTWKEWVNGPELFHWDDLIWRRRSPAMRRLERAAQTAQDAAKGEEAVAATLELPTASIERFWREFVPVAAPPRATVDGWQEMATTIERVRQRFSQQDVLEFERIAAGVAIALSARHNGHSLGDQFGLPSYLHVGMLMQQVIQQGRDLYRQAWEDAEVLKAEAARMTEASGLWLWTVFRPDSMRHHAYACKLVAQWVPGGWRPILPGMSLLSGFFRGQFPEQQPEAGFSMSRAIHDGSWQIAFPPPEDQS